MDPFSSHCVNKEKPKNNKKLTLNEFKKKQTKKKMIQKLLRSSLMTTVMKNPSRKLRSFKRKRPSLNLKPKKVNRLRVLRKLMSEFQILVF